MSPTVLKTIAEALDCFQSGVLTAHRQGSSDIESFSSGVRELVAHLYSLGVVEAADWTPEDAKAWEAYRTAPPTEGDIRGSALKDAWFAGLTRGRSTSALATPPASFRPTHRHVKRGSVYRVVGEAEVQVSNHAPTDRAVLAYPECPETWRLKPEEKKGLSIIQEGERLTVYAEENGKLWTRFSDEFHDGRFTPVEKVAIRTMGPIEGWNGIAALYRLSPPAQRG